MKNTFRVLLVTLIATYITHVNAEDAAHNSMITLLAEADVCKFETTKSTQAILQQYLLEIAGTEKFKSYFDDVKLMKIVIRMSHPKAEESKYCLDKKVIYKSENIIK